MQILLSAYACGPNKGSEEGIGWNWALELARLGHQVLVLTEIEERAAIEAEQVHGRVPANLRFEFFMPAWLDRLRNRGMAAGFEGLTAHLTHLVWQVLAYRHVRRRFPDLPFGLVHHITYSGIRHPTLLGRLPVPMVLGPLGGGERAPFALRRSLPWRGWLKDLVRDLHTCLVRYDPITRRACADALVVYVKTEQSRAALPRRFRHKVAIQLEVGIRDHACPPRRERVPGEPFRLLYVGRFLYWKGMHLGIRAFAEYLARGGQGRLTMLGRGPDEAAWRGLARELRVDHAIEWHGWVDHAKVGEFYGAHDALLFPSLHDSSGNAVLESLAHGLPVICLDLGGPAELVDASCGKVVATGGRSEGQCVAALTDAIGELACSSDLCRRLSEGASACARRLDWPRQVARVYDDIIRRLESQPAGDASRAASEVGLERS